MIQINDDDLPITVAEKIINGTKPNDSPDFMKALEKAVTGDASNTKYMFGIEEIKEIADYLMVYYVSHTKSEDEE